IKHLLVRRVRFGFKAVAGFGFQCVPREEFAITAALETRGRIPFVGEKMFHRRQQECAETSLLLAYPREAAAREQSGKELLRGILGLMRTVSTAADEGIKRIPISPTKGF